MTPQELKNSILQLAIQGKLVEQRPEEGTAQELYAQIQAEKQRLIQSGKLKKEKSLPEITEDEKPFEIPEGWMWVRIKEITILNPKNDLDNNLKTSFIPMTLLSDGYRSSYTYEIRSWGEIKKDLRILQWEILELQKSLLAFKIGNPQFSRNWKTILAQEQRNYLLFV